MRRDTAKTLGQPGDKRAIQPLIDGANKDTNADGIPMSSDQVRMFNPKGFWMGFKGLPPLYIRKSREPIGRRGHAGEALKQAGYEGVVPS